MTLMPDALLIELRKPGMAIRSGARVLNWRLATPEVSEKIRAYPADFLLQDR